MQNGYVKPNESKVRSVDRTRLRVQLYEYDYVRLRFRLGVRLRFNKPDLRQSASRQKVADVIFATATIEVLVR